jgi:hypothetical protein
MRTRFAAAALVVLLATAALAQTPPPPAQPGPQAQPAQPGPQTPPGVQAQPGARQQAPAPAGPQGEDKLRWVCRQLKVTKEQMQQADALIAVYRAELKEAEANSTELLLRLQDKFAEFQAAKNAGENEKAERIREELKNLAPTTQAENHFYEALSDTLTKEQKDRLPELRKKSETLGDLSLRPIHILRATENLKLDSEQQLAMEKLFTEYRDRANKEKPASKAEENERVEQLAAAVRAILKPEQVEQYEKILEDARETPATKPSVPPGQWQPSSPPPPAAPPPPPTPAARQPAPPPPPPPAPGK